MEDRKIRRELIPYLKDAKKWGHKPFLRKHALIVNGRTYDLNYLKENVQLDDAISQQDIPEIIQDMTLQQVGNVETREGDNSQRMEERASAVWTRSNNTKEVMSTQAVPVGRKSMPPHTPPVVVISDIETRQEDRQEYNLRSWLMKDADSTNKKRKNNKARSESTYGSDGVAGVLKIGFLNIEGLQNKLGTTDFLDLLRVQDILGIAESWAGLETYNISGYTSYFKGRCKISKYGRNPGGLAVYIKDDISEGIKVIVSDMKEILWLNIREEYSLPLEICIDFIYNAPPNLRWYNHNFTRELEKEINGLRDKYAKTEFLLMGDMNCHIGMLQVDLPHWDALENVGKEFNTYGSRVNKDSICNIEGRQLIEFCERNTFDILNGKYGVDSKGKFTFINQVRKSFIDYAVASEGLRDNLVEFKIGNEIISSHMPLLIELGNAIFRDVKFVHKQITHKIVKYRWDERVKFEFLDIMNSNVNEDCMQGLRYLLQKDQMNEAYNLLLFSVRRAGAKMRCVKRMFSRKGHWFDEKCWEKRRQARVALTKSKEKEYERIVGKKRCIYGKRRKWNISIS
jgi:exonuclease III